MEPDNDGQRKNNFWGKNSAPSYHGKDLIKKELLKHSKNIQLLSRTKTASRKNSYGERRISYQKYILEKDKEWFLAHIRKPTVTILENLVLDKNLLGKVEKNQFTFRLKKNSIISE